MGGSGAHTRTLTLAHEKKNGHAPKRRRHHPGQRAPKGQSRNQRSNGGGRGGGRTSSNGVEDSAARAGARAGACAGAVASRRSRGARSNVTGTAAEAAEAERTEDKWRAAHSGLRQL